jgi:DNA polymerase alpha subunit A
VDTTWPFDAKTVLAEYTKKEIGMEKCDSERALLSLFMAKYYKTDPDLIVGHDILGFDIGTLIHRLVSQKIQQWSKLGRLRRANTSNIGKVSPVKTFLMERW